MNKQMISVRVIGVSVIWALLIMAGGTVSAQGVEQDGAGEADGSSGIGAPDGGDSDESLQAESPAQEQESGEVAGEKEAEAVFQAVVTTSRPMQSSATLTHTPWIETPQSVHTIDGETMQDWGITTAQEAWSMSAGVQASDQVLGSRYGGMARMRGIQGSQTLLNGFAIPQRMSMYYDLSSIESIDFMKGPADAVDGTQTPGFTMGGFGGQVNMNSKTPVAAPYYSAYLANRSLGNNMSQLSLELNQPFLNDQVLARVDLSGQMGRKFYVPQDFAPEYSYSAAPVVVWNPHKMVRVTARGSWNQSKVYAYKGIPHVFGDLMGSHSGFLGDEDSTVNFSAYMGQLETDLYFNSHLSANVALSAMGQALDYDMWAWSASRTFSFGDMYDTGTGLPAFSSTDTSSDALAGRAYLVGNLKTGWWHHKLLVGGDLESMGSVTDTTPWQVPADPISIDNPVLPGRSQIGSNTGPGPGGKSEWSTWRLGAMAQYQAEITDYLRLLGGFRLDSHQYTTAMGPQSQTYDKADPGWRAAAVILPIPQVALYGNFTAGKSPNFGLKDVDGKDITDSMDFNMVEVGVKGQVMRGLQLSGALFRVDQSNVPISVPTTDGSMSTAVELTGEMAYKGVELAAQGRITPSWNVTASYTYIEVDADSLIASHNLSPHSASAFTSYRLPGAFRNVRLGAGYRFVDDRHVGYGLSASAPDPRDKDSILPAYHLVDLLVEYTIPAHLINAQSWVLRLNASNLLDVDHYTVARQVSETSAGEPRSLMMSMAAHF